VPQGEQTKAVDAPADKNEDARPDHLDELSFYNQILV
jgi:hypothetical protein